MSLPRDVLQEIQLVVKGGFDNRDSLYFRIFETMFEELGVPEEVTHIDQLDAETRTELQAAIEEAFSRREAEMQSWPSTTDCDRLRKAFDVLDKQGIVALENCGYTQDDGIRRASLVALARDEVGAVSNDGYCFFHSQDVQHAVEGGRLHLAFGTFKDDVAGPETLAVKCPTCNGRGWVQPDEAKFPSPCPDHVTTVPAKPAPSRAEQVGSAVVEACRNAGLDVEWSGATNTRILLPRFNWQRRLITTKESDLRDFLESWELELRAGFTAQDQVLETMAERAGDWFTDSADFGPRLVARLSAHTETFLEAERAREATWAEPTTNDRITAAFEELSARGILAREDSGSSIQDGWGYAGTAATPESRGVCFYHREDVIDAVSGRGLYLAYGALGASNDDEATLALGQEIVAVLETHGVPCSWSGSIRERIRVAPFEWRMRRWTNPPAHQRSEARSREKVVGIEFPPPARQYAEVVRAVRDESRIDLRRAKRMRSAWKEMGNSGEAQMGHLGIPSIFVPTGEFVTVVPVPAAENLREQKNEIFARGAR
jgi:hypothetical protein